MKRTIRNPALIRKYFPNKERPELSDFDEPMMDSLVCTEPKSLTEQIQIAAGNVTERLRVQLEIVGVTNPLILYHANIYERATVNLAEAITQAQLSPTLSHSALQETMLIIRSLEELFSGCIRIKSMNNHGAVNHFEGYLQYPYGVRGDKKRITIAVQTIDTYSGLFQRLTRANTQILIKEIMGETSTGRVIAASDAGWRVGLRYGGSELTQWVVSIDAGLKNPIEARWRSIYPLSQAICEIQRTFNPSLDPKSSLCTYHLATLPMTSNHHGDFAIRRFKEFNQGLLEVLQNITR